MESHTIFKGVCPNSCIVPSVWDTGDLKAWEPLPRLSPSSQTALSLLAPPTLRLCLLPAGQSPSLCCQTFPFGLPFSSLLSASRSRKNRARERVEYKWGRKPRLLWLSKDFCQRWKYQNVPDRNGKWCFRVGTHVSLEKSKIAEDCSLLLCSLSSLFPDGGLNSVGSPSHYFILNITILNINPSKTWKIQNSQTNLASLGSRISTFTTTMHSRPGDPNSLLTGLPPSTLVLSVCYEHWSQSDN